MRESHTLPGPMESPVFVLPPLDALCYWLGIDAEETDEPADTQRLAASNLCLNPSKRMPEISRFYGIVIGMFYHEHRPPHFHVRYGEHQAVIRITNFVLTEGELPPAGARPGRRMGGATPA
jgi:hypothetical protein